MRISIIVATSENNTIGRDGEIPWRLSDDLKYFREKTEGHPVIMGRKTYESLPNGPLKNRRNIVVTRESNYSAPGCEVASSLDEAIMYGHKDNPKEEIFVIGGEEIYRQVLHQCNYVYLTRVHAWIKGDKEFPALDTETWEEVERQEHTSDEKHKFAFSFITYKRKGRLHFGD